MLPEARVISGPWKCQVHPHADCTTNRDCQRIQGGGGAHIRDGNTRSGERKVPLFLNCAVRLQIYTEGLSTGDWESQWEIYARANNWTTSLEKNHFYILSADDIMKSIKQPLLSSRLKSHYCEGFQVIEETQRWKWKWQRGFLHRALCLEWKLKPVL